MRIVTFLRDLIFSTMLLFLGLFFFAKHWIGIDLIWGVFFLVMGIACALKMSALPFNNITPFELLKIYFPQRTLGLVTKKERQKILARSFFVLVFLPAIFLIPVGYALKPNFIIEGYFAGASILTILGLLLGTMYFISAITDMLKR